MTHSHGLDFRLCEELLSNAELQYIGLIGSKTKAAKFKHALALGGEKASAISKLICPIGTQGPEGKEPGVIALSVLSELLKTLIPLQKQ